MDKKQLYTALSRTTKSEYMQLSNKKLKQKYVNPPFVNMETINSYFIDDYQMDKYTRLHSEIISDKVYIGSSIRNLREGLTEHMTDKKSPIRSRLLGAFISHISP